MVDSHLLAQSQWDAATAPSGIRVSRYSCPTIITQTASKPLQGLVRQAGWGSIFPLQQENRGWQGSCRRQWGYFQWAQDLLFTERSPSQTPSRLATAATAYKGGPGVPYLGGAEA